MQNTLYKLIGTCLCFSSLHAVDGLTYLNSLRTQTGLPAFSTQSNLRAAAQNHSAYLERHTLTGHYEDSNKAGYTGYAPSNRVEYTGYLSTFVSENVSYGTPTIKASIDGLFSAIYHRFGFLSLNKDEIGLGISNNKLHYTYDMGNSTLNQLCQTTTYTGNSYYALCFDSSKKISISAYKTSADSIKMSAPKLILWPANQSQNIPPVFYDESPDPLPNYDVSGYPVSVEFNSKNNFNSDLLSITNFSLRDIRGVTLDTIISMNAENDPNHKLTDKQFAIFPTQRLEWGSRYQAKILYTYDGTEKTKEWCFSTISLSNKVDRVYKVQNNDNVTYNVISGKKYAIYLVPNDGRDKISRYSLSYNVTSIDKEFIDSNTISIKIVGSVGSYVDIDFSNGQKVKLVVASTDTASNPLNQTCTTATDSDGDGVVDTKDAFPYDASETVDTDHDGIGNNADRDDDNDGISDVLERANGLNPLNARDGQQDLDHDGFSNAIEISVGSNIRSKASHPTWAPVMMGDLITFIPSFR